jgi:hypothetical protein
MKVGSKMGLKAVLWLWAIIVSRFRVIVRDSIKPGLLEDPSTTSIYKLPFEVRSGVRTIYNYARRHAGIMAEASPRY